VFTVQYGTMIFPGDTIGNWGLGQQHMEGHKPDLFPLPVFLGLELLVTVTFMVLLVGRRRLWNRASLGPAGVMLVALALSQLVPMLFTSSTDRYHLAVAAPLIPLLAAAASRVESPRVRQAGFAWAWFAIIAGVGWYVAGEYDYQAWQVARDAAAKQAFAQAPPLEVDAGYEAMATYVAIPAVERTGQIPSAMNPSNLKPLHPRLQLVFAGPDDTRPGVAYSSVAPGKIVIRPGLP
jgi:hypothetical protein